MQTLDEIVDLLASRVKRAIQTEEDMFGGVPVQGTDKAVESYLKVLEMRAKIVASKEEIDRSIPVEERLEELLR